MFMEDPELGAINTPNGKLQFLQLVGMTMDELTAARGWNTLGVLGELAEEESAGSDGFGAAINLEGSGDCSGDCRSNEPRGIHLRLLGDFGSGNSGGRIAR